MKIFVFLDIDGVLNNDNFIRSFSIKEYRKKRTEWDNKYRIPMLSVNNIKALGESMNNLSKGITMKNNTFTKVNDNLPIVNDIHIILSSTWRGCPDVINKLNHVFKDHGQSIVIEDVTGYDEHRFRGNEVAEYLKDKEYDNYIIVDDDGDFHEQQMKHLYLVDSSVGFRFCDFESAWNKIKKEDS